MSDIPIRNVQRETFLIGIPTPCLSAYIWAKYRVCPSICSAGPPKHRVCPHICTTFSNLQNMHT